MRFSIAQKLIDPIESFRLRFNNQSACEFFPSFLDEIYLPIFKRVTLQIENFRFLTNQRKCVAFVKCMANLRQVHSEWLNKRTLHFPFTLSRSFSFN